MTKSTEDRQTELEAALEQMLKRVSGVPLSVVVKALAGCEVIPVDASSPEDKELLEKLDIAIRAAAAVVRQAPIVRPRPNEVGNDIEVFVKNALTAQGFRVAKPTSKNGAAKGVGYPDILIFDRHGRPTYIECKTYSADTAASSMRSFYVSPSESFKVSHDARHLVLSYEMVKTPIERSINAAYTPVAFKLVDATELLCDVKYEFNASNRRLYDEALILDSGRF